MPAVSDQVNGSPVLVAHRGFSSRHPEMTRAAYQAAIEWAYQTEIPLGLECDVHFSADDELICLHDLTVDRTSTGSGPAYQRTVAELKLVDFGSRSVHDPEPEQRELVTLRELMMMVRDARGDHVPVSLVVETKHPNDRGREVEERVAAMLAEFGWNQPGAPVRLLSFSDGTASQLELATARLVEQGATGAILDLRNNPGGLLSQAIETVSVYLRDGVVCQTDGAHEEYHSYRVTGDVAYPDLPLVVLVNRGSASAAEIFAAALLENRRAKLIGDRTFGKASVQSIEQLSNGGALKLTTAQYVTSHGHDISGVGLRPQMRALDDPLTRPDEALAAARRVAARLIAG